jgi:hypothetical protein
VSEVKKKEESYFNIVVDKIGVVTVDISGRHLNKATFNRLQLALKKAYRANINNYVRLSRQGLSHEEIEEIVNNSVVKSIQKIEPVPVIEKKVEKPEVQENLKLSLGQILERKAAEKQAKYDAEQEKTNATERVEV